MSVGEMPGAAQLKTTAATSATIPRVVTRERRFCTMPLQQSGPPRNPSALLGRESSIGRSRGEVSVRAWSDVAVGGSASDERRATGDERRATGDGRQ